MTTYAVISNNGRVLLCSKNLAYARAIVNKRGWKFKTKIVTIGKEDSSEKLN